MWCKACETHHIQCTCNVTVMQPVVCMFTLIDMSLQCWRDSYEADETIEVEVISGRLMIWSFHHFIISSSYPFTFLLLTPPLNWTVIFIFIFPLNMPTFKHIHYAALSWLLFYMEIPWRAFCRQPHYVVIFQLKSELFQLSCISIFYLCGE